MGQALTKHARTMQYIEEFGTELIRAGFRVWVSKDPHWRTYLYAAKNGKLGYCQVDDLSGCIKYTTVHKPHTSIGCGFQYAEGLGSVEGMENCCNCYAPHWAICDAKCVVKWDLDKWIKSKETTHLMEITL